ncbi:RNA-binding S4 domain-containing protein [Alkaliphilus pronyensis]|uniref:RQC P-site tRNA stabilizing factor n=1 Tax=Alkaliphilus pronyensis TaxID=1482732 RepID=A0A6I0F5Z8_9FIRM|nr:RNA-binding S4 domain-containing protein [Alkaliphilus pronyensis]KAB3531893.1 RNA-binding S4 domain-containing protein [Alkaliphilus pronyensis]
MRLDKYLKISRIIKRRTVAKEASEKGRVKVNNKEAKPGTEVKVGDIIEIQFGDNAFKAEITEIKEHVSKDEAGGMYRIIEG